MTPALEGRADGPPLLLVHALGTDAGLWTPQMPALTRSHRVLRWELPGHGRNVSAQPPRSLGDLEAAVLGALDEHGLEAVDFCGISIGGLLGLELAIRHPARIRRLAVANTAARVGSVEHWTERAAAVERRGMAAVGADVVPGLFSPELRARHPEVVERALEVFAATDAAGYVGCCAALRDADLTGDVGSIRAPALVIAGAADRSTPPEAGAWLADAIPGGRLMTLETGHLANVEAPAEFTAALTHFLMDAE